jgi:hypothetical protein
MSQLENLLAGECRPSAVFGAAYTGKPKPSDLSTFLYLCLWIGGIVTVGRMFF